ncbi:hypothetical protein K2Z83_23605 [Oscillochloris sp. ZM17-4]|uniref:hypothetical protein n=1 Tax=Oscillochloris sp. ZM17-4 TaxID=2866714 RepID=UPI001C736337|nr:hypothetical protein [Oscillochloris sp. ZM17-4]MBX0330647.1 hypothetical protein [Oscillochloris sp. ZM17-4]
MREQNYLLEAQERHRQLLAESLRAAQLRAAHGDLPNALPAYAPLMARLGALLVSAGAALRARYSEGAAFADEGAPEGRALARTLH